MFRIGYLLNHFDFLLNYYYVLLYIYIYIVCVLNMFVNEQKINNFIVCFIVNRIWFDLVDRISPKNPFNVDTGGTTFRFL